MSKYFPLPEEYARPQSVYDCKCKDEIYYTIRAILKDPSFGNGRRYSLANQPQKENLQWYIYKSTDDRNHVMTLNLPCESSSHAAALLVKMGSHTVEETWEEYKDMWYEDIEQQLAHLEKGVGP